MNDIDCFLIEKIKSLPVVASQDQEFWLSAIMSCLRVLKHPKDRALTAGRLEITAASLAGLFGRCVEYYQDLVCNGLLEAQTPSWDELLREATVARQRIVQLRVSRLFQWFSTTDAENEAKQLAIRTAFKIAQSLSVLPIDFIEYWHQYLRTAGKHPSFDEACSAMHELDGTACQAAVQVAANAARMTLVQGYSRYALRLAHGYVNSGLEYADLVQEALVGLLVAADKFDFLEHRRFAIFATTWMWRYITRSLAKDSQLIRVPVHAFQKRREMQGELSEHLKQVGWAPTLGDLIVSKGMDLKECLPLLQTALPPIRIEVPKPELTKRQLEVVLARNDELLSQVEMTDVIEAIRDQVRTLPKRDQDVIALRFGLVEPELEHTLEEIGERYQLTRERIRQIEKKALELLAGGRMRRRLLRLNSVLHERNHLSEDNLVRARQATRKSVRDITCDEGLIAYHPFRIEDELWLEEKLSREFGSRQTNVRQSVTIKGQIVAAFRGYKAAMHTAELRERIHLLYPLERHNKNTLYSAMAANPDDFIALGGGVFGLRMVESAEVRTLGGAGVAEATPAAPSSLDIRWTFSPRVASATPLV